MLTKLPPLNPATSLIPLLSGTCFAPIQFSLRTPTFSRLFKAQTQYELDLWCNELRKVISAENAKNPATGKLALCTVNLRLSHLHTPNLSVDPRSWQLVVQNQKKGMFCNSSSRLWTQISFTQTSIACPLKAYEYSIACFATRV